MGSRELQIQVLGELTVTSGDAEVAIPGSRKTRALLSYLLLRNRPATREHLCELLWPHPDDPRAALRWSLTKLRPVLNDATEHLAADRSSVAVVGLDDAVDLVAVEKLLARSLDQVATADLQRAAGAFHGELLDGLELSDCYRFYEWLTARREAARRLHRRLLMALVERLDPDPEAALPHARKRVQLDPLEEAAHVDVIRLLGALGRDADAHIQADRCRDILDRELRLAPSAAVDRALRQVRRTPLVAAPAASAPPAVPAPAAEDAGLFGRAEECARLESFLASPGSIILLEGEPGIGKTRLLEELARRASAAGGQVFRGRSWEAEMVRPYGAWIDLLAGVDADLVPAGHRAELARLMPAVGEAAGDLDENRLFIAVAGLLAVVADGGRPLVLVFDDLHWIDPASAALLNAVSRGPLPQGTAVACAGRTGEFADNDAARALVRGWARAGRLNRVSVGPLDDRDAAALARSLTSDSRAEHIVDGCGGNPLFVIEAARDDDLAAGGTLAGLLHDRLAMLDATAAEVMGWAAVLGREAPADLLSALAGRSLDQFLAATGTLERHGILRAGAEAWDFAHDLLRRAAYGTLSGPRRILMHGRAARTLADTPDPDGALAGDLAYHAARGGQPEQAARASVVAGDRALRLAAPDDAYALAHRGLHEAEKLPDSVELQIELLQVMVHAGLGRRRGELLGAKLDALAAGARSAGLHAAERTARYLMSVVSEETGDLDAARDHSLEAEQAGRAADPETRLRALANTARCLVQLEREPERAAELLDEAELLAAELDTEVLDIPWGRGLLGALTGDVAAARAALAQGVETARDLDNHWALFECLARLSMLDVAAGNTDGVERRDPELQETAAKLGEGSEAPFAAVLLALARRTTGAADHGLDAALGELRAADTKGMLAYALNAAASQDLERNDPATAGARAREALEAADQVGRRRPMARSCLILGRAGLAAGDTPAARRHADEAEEHLETLSAVRAARADLQRLRNGIHQHEE